MTIWRTITSGGRRRVLAVILGLVLGAGSLPASADIGLSGGSYTGATEPTGYKPQSKLWYYDNLWWGALFNPASGKFEIYKYTPNQWRWSSTGIVVEDRKTAKIDALLDGSSLYVGASIPSALPDGTKALYVHRFHYDAANDRFVRETSNGKISLGNTAVEEIVLAKDTQGHLWANWTNGGTVYVTHSTDASHTNWITPYALVGGLVSGSTGDSASLVAFGGKIGVMWSNTVPLSGENGFHFAVHVDGAGDAVSSDPLLPSDWTFEAVPPQGANEADDHINLKSLNGDVYAAVKHNHAGGTEPQISVLRRTAAGVWTSHVVWLNSSNTTRPILEIDSGAGRALVFASGLYSGAIYRKDASLTDLAFPAGDGAQFIALSSMSNGGLDNATSTKQNVSSSTGVLVMAGDEGNDTYAFNYLTLGGPIVPAPPVGVTALSGLGSVSLSWSAPGNDGGSAITGYVVVPYLNGVPLAPQASTGTTKLVTGLLAGTAYTFTVQAQNVAGLGPASTASAPVTTFGPPGAPTAVTATAGNGAANVTWASPSSNGGSPITGYTVTASPGGMTASVGGTATNSDIGGLTNGVSYTFTVKATNLVGTGPASAPSAPVVPLAVPGAPSGVSAAADDGSANVSWNAPAVTGGSAITGYVVSWAVNGVDQSSSTVMSTATSRTITGLSNGTTYSFKVAAINALGRGLASAPSAPVTPTAPDSFPSSRPVGYRMLGADGFVYAFGDAQDFGEPGAAIGTASAVDIESNPSGDGYWVVDESGQVFAYRVPHFGNVDLTTLRVGEKVTSLSATPGADGYWIFTTAGRVLTFGKAKLHGDLLQLKLNGPVLDSIATPSGNGYYMVASDGGVFTFGDAEFLGSMGAVRLNAPVQSLVPDPDGLGYWLVASDGGVFGFQAGFRGSMGSSRLNKPITGMVPYGNGYLMVAEDGGIFNFSDRPFQGSLGASPPARPIVSVSALA